ncbi:MAG: helix-turn-helix domain-containing protein [Actinomycetota bacterium]|nr:helix-turn-helix domain-containing protein [Actinomycetota bacterium]
MSLERVSDVTEQSRWMGTPAVAEYLGVNQRTVYRLIDEGELPAYKFGRVIRLRERDVAAYVERSRIEPGTLEHLYPEPKLS